MGLLLLGQQSHILCIELQIKMKTYKDIVKRLFIL